MKKQTIGYIPFVSADNAYVERTIEILSTFAEVRDVPSLRQFLERPFAYRFRSYDFIVANWVENGMVKKDGSISSKGVLGFVLTILMLKILARRVVFVRHNNYPHNASAKSGRWAAKFIDFAENFFDNVVTHSGHNLARRRTYIPHPLYRVPAVQSSESAESGNYFLIFGRILPYKKIEGLIAGITDNVHLVIAGSSPDERYIEKLRNLSRGKHVRLINRFIDDDEAARLARASLGIVVTHNDEDMVVSGTLFYALSVGVPIFIVSSPFVEWLQQECTLPGVTVGPDVHSICELLSRVNGGAPCMHHCARRDVERFFGDDVVKRGWLNVFGLRLGG